MKRTLLLIIAVLLFAPLGYAADGNEQDTIKRTFQIRPGGTLFLDLDSGTIVIKTTSDSEVHVELERRVKGVKDDDLKLFLERHEWGIRKDGNSIFIDSRFENEDDGWSRNRWRKHSNFRLRVTVLVPENFNIDFSTGAGNVEIDDLTGEITGRTGAGNIVLGDIVGPVDIVSGAGNIEVDSVEGYTHMVSGAGDIDIEEISGEVIAHTGAGNINVNMTAQPKGDSDLSSGAGNITVYMNDDIAVDVEGRASIGSANSDFGLKVSGKWMSKSFEGHLNGGGPALTLRSGVGSVSLLRN